MFTIALPYWFLSLLTGLCAGLIGLISLRAWHRKEAAAFALVMAGTAVWGLGYAAELRTTDLATAITWMKLEYLGILLIAPAWMTFSLFLPYNKRAYTWTTFWWLMLVPLFVLVFIWTNEWHHLFWTETTAVVTEDNVFFVNSYGPVFWLEILYTYLLLIAATIYQIRGYIGATGIGRLRLVFVVAAVLPFLFNVLNVLRVFPSTTFDFTLLGLLITGIFILGGATRGFSLAATADIHTDAVAGLNVGLVIYDRFGQVIDANQAAKDITRTTSQAEMQQLFAERFPDLMQMATPQTREIDGWSDGQVVLAQIAAVHKGNARGGVALTLTDVSDQRASERKLAEVETRYLTIFNCIRDAIFVETADGRILDVNDAACNMYGYTREAFLKKNVRELVPEDHEIFLVPEGSVQDRPPEFLNKAMNSVNRRADGTLFPVEINGSLITIFGQVCMLVLVRDVTEKRKAEEAVRAQEQYVRKLNEITWAALMEKSFNGMLQSLADRLGELFNASGTYITIWDETNQTARPGAAYGAVREIYTNVVPNPGENTLTQTALQLGHTLAVDDVTNSPYLTPRIAAMFPSRSILAIPLLAGEQKLGAALIAYDQQRNFREEDIHFADQAAGQVALSISRASLIQTTNDLLEETRQLNANLEKTVDERTVQLIDTIVDLEEQMAERKLAQENLEIRLQIEKWFSSLTAKFLDSDDFDFAMSDALAGAAKITGAQRTYLFQFDAAGETFSCTHEWHGPDLRPMIPHMQCLAADRFKWWAEQLRIQPVLRVADPEKLPPEAAAEKAFLKSYGAVSILAYPVYSGFRLRGFLGIDGSTSEDTHLQTDIELLAAAARTIGSAIYRRQAEADLMRANEELTAAYDATIVGWAKALEWHENETAGHSERTVSMAIQFARYLGVRDEAELDHIRRGALLHDIGKMGIDKSILLKPGKLDPDERKEVEKHPRHSELMLSPIAYLAPAAVIPYYHHEKWDGSGYPRGLKGEEIPFYARLFALVDVWDAVSFDRPYRKAMPQEKVIAIIEESAGKHFDPTLAAAFLKMLREDFAFMLDRSGHDDG